MLDGGYTDAGRHQEKNWLPCNQGGLLVEEGPEGPPAAWKYKQPGWKIMYRPEAESLQHCGL